jgi:hypothetical protein
MGEDPPPKNRYTQILERLFLSKYRAGVREIPFTRDEIVDAASTLGLERPKNIGDLLYTFRFRARLPEPIRSTAPAGEAWIIRPKGKAQYALTLVKQVDIQAREGLSVTKIPDATPGIIAMHALTDEQALLARIRYNRLVDIFTRITCYSMQSHLRTSVPDIGQIETDEVYVGIDSFGAQYVLPIQAKRRGDRHNMVQIESDLAMCEEKFPTLIPRPVGAQFLDDTTIALFAFERTDDGITLSEERHYRLVPHDQLTAEELAAYRHVSTA